MDTTSIVIIVIATVTAIAFKWFLYRRIQAWILQDYIKGLAGGNEERRRQLQTKADQLRAQGIKGRELFDTLSGHNKTF